MHQTSPHLPRRSSSLKQRQVLQTVPWLVWFVLLTALMATAVSTAFLAWYVPDYVRYQVPTTISTATVQQKNTHIDPLLARMIDERTVTLFAATTDTPVIRKSERYADAVVLSSDGWIAFAGEQLPVQSLVALDADGQLYDIVTYVRDPDQPIIYAKLESATLRISSIADWRQDVPFGMSVWLSLGTGWTRTQLDTQVLQQTDTNMQLTEEYFRYELPSAVSEDGAAAFADDGTYIGFVKDGLLVPSWHVRDALPYVLAGESIPVQQTDIRGEVLAAYRDELSGMFVDRPAIRISTTNIDLLEKNDILVAIEDAPIDLFSLAQDMQQRPLTLRIIRDGAYQTLQILE